MFEQFTEYLTGWQICQVPRLLKAENSSASGGFAPLTWPPDQWLCPRPPLQPRLTTNPLASSLTAKMTDVRHVRFYVRCPKNVFFVSLCRISELRSLLTTYRSSIETVALNCLVCQKMSVMSTRFGDRLANKQTDTNTFDNVRFIQFKICCCVQNFMMIFRWDMAI